MATGKKEVWLCDTIVLAAEPPTLSGLSKTDLPIPEARTSTCLYYVFSGPPPVTAPPRAHSQRLQRLERPTASQPAPPSITYASPV